MNQQADESGYLAVGELGVLRRLRFVPSGRVGGRYAGRHRSVRRGRSVEFADYRPFVAGDTPGDVDWKVYGRSDRLYVKRFEQQTEVSAMLVVDGSASMDYAGAAGGAGKAENQKSRRAENKARREGSWLRGVESAAKRLSPLSRKRRAREVLSKYEFASKLASAMAFLLVQQQDRVGLAVAREGVERWVDPAGGWRQARAVATALAESEPGAWQRGAGLGAALAEVSRRRRRGREVVIVLSDLYDEPGVVLRGLRRLRHAGHEVVVFHVLHKDELVLPSWGQAVVVDSETGRRVRLDEPRVRAAYQQRLGEWRERWVRDLRAVGVGYALASMERGYLEVLRGYLVSR